MSPQAIFFIQFITSTLVWALLLKECILPHFSTLSHNQTLSFLLIPHLFRHIGLVFLVPGVVNNPLPANFAPAAAFGDLAAGFLAIAAFIALRKSWKYALPLTLLANSVGTVDLIIALRHQQAIPDFGAAWFIPTFLVPLLLVTHFLIFKQIFRNRVSTSTPIAQP